TSLAYRWRENICDLSCSRRLSRGSTSRLLRVTNFEMAIADLRRCRSTCSGYECAPYWSIRRMHQWRKKHLPLTITMRKGPETRMNRTNESRTTGSAEE